MKGMKIGRTNGEGKGREGKGQDAAILRTPLKWREA